MFLLTVSCLLVILNGEHGVCARGCRWRDLLACLEQRSTAYLRLCRKNDDASRYDYEGAIDCVETVLASCPEGRLRQAATRAKAQDALVQLKVCQAAFPCLHGELALRHLHRCDVQDSRDAGIEYCKRTQNNINCESAAARKCTKVHSVLYSRWLTIREKAPACEDLYLPGGSTTLAANIQLLTLLLPGIVYINRHE